MTAAASIPDIEGMTAAASIPEMEGMAAAASIPNIQYRAWQLLLVYLIYSIGHGSCC